MTHNLAPRRPFRWQDGYGAFSLRKRDGPTLERYILSQKQHHSTNQAQAELQPSRPQPALAGFARVAGALWGRAARWRARCEASGAADGLSGRRVAIEDAATVRAHVDAPEDARVSGDRLIRGCKPVMLVGEDDPGRASIVRAIDAAHAVDLGAGVERHGA